MEERNGPEETCHDTERKLRARIEALEKARDTMGHLWANEAAAKLAALVRAEAAEAALKEAVEVISRIADEYNEDWQAGQWSLAFLAKHGETK